MREIAGLAIDARALSGLREQAGSDPKRAAREAAAQFESLFMKQMLKSMREAMPSSGLTDGPGQDTYRDMLDGQFAQMLSGRPGGLADVLARQLAQHLDPSANKGADDGKLNPLNGSNRVREFAPLEGARVNTVGGLPSMLANALAPAAKSRDESAGLAAADPAASPAAARIDNSTGGSFAQHDFVNRLYPQARVAQARTGLRAEFILGQAALESGWGRAEMRHPDGQAAHNLFGIKAGSNWTGRTVDVLTTEYENGLAKKQVEKFRAYDSYADAFSDWARLMSDNPRYANVLRAGSTPEGFAAGLQRAGYATDPDYARKLERTIEKTIELRRLQT